MIAYVYTAKTSQGKLVTGELEARDANSAAQKLMEKELFPLKVEPKKNITTIKLGLFGGVSSKQKTLMIKQFSTLVNAGLPITQALQVLQDQQQSPQLKKIVAQIQKDIEGGSSLSESFSKFTQVFSVTDISLIQVGEASGTLDIVLVRMAKQLEKDQALRSKVRTAMVYPSFVLFVVLMVVVVMLVYVMPKISGLYEGFGSDKLPLATQIMLSSSEFIIGYWWLIGFAIIALVLMLKSFLLTKNGKKMWDDLKIKIPGINVLVKGIIMARFSRTLGTLMGSGVPVLQSLSIAGKASGNVIYEEAISDAANKVQAGANLSEPLKKSKIFPLMVGQMISVGEQTGEMDHMLDNLANYYEEEVDNLIKGLSSLIEPIIIIFLGGLVLGILVAIMMPIYSISDLIYK
jgi:type IV pilus assembly protein PilC